MQRVWLLVGKGRRKEMNWMKILSKHPDAQKEGSGGKVRDVGESDRCRFRQLDSPRLPGKPQCNFLHLKKKKMKREWVSCLLRSKERDQTLCCRVERAL